MCGIVGCFAPSHIADSHREAIGKSLAAIEHRGPDDEGLYHDENILLGHRRLSIIDTSKAGAQPMSDADNRYHLIYNGECYNFKELRRELQLKGIEFISESDTEVVLQLLISEGTEGIKKIRGFFGLAFYDKTNRELIIARDRFGIKPIYYYADKSQFIFSSELQGILPFTNSLNLEFQSLNAYLHLNYIPSPHTIFTEVRKLKPGHIISIGSDLQVNTEKYYSLDLIQPKFHGDLDKDIIERLDHSVRDRMMADVPLGCFLSGGLDSSAIVALASRHVDKLKTYSIVFRDEKQYDESPYARIVADHFKTEHTEIEISTTDLLVSVKEILNQTDEPFADSSGIALHQLCKKVSTEIKVALSGDGGDELFAGYRKHLAMFYAFNYPTFSKFLSLFSRLSSKFPESRSVGMSDTFRKVNRYFDGAAKKPLERYWTWAGYGNPVSGNLINGKTFDIQRFLDDTISQIPDGMERCLLTDIEMVLEGDMLVKTDRMSMMNGLEVRVPFLDHPFVKFAMSIPSKHKIDFKRSKKLLRNAFREILPKEILEKKKQGFEVPLISWLRNELSEEMSNILSRDRVETHGIFNYDEVAGLQRKLHSSNSANSEYALWNLMIFTSWYERVIKISEK